MNLTAKIGDSPVFAIPLVWGGAAFAPGEDWGLIFTLKSSAADLDPAALVQKASGVGITAAGYTALVSFVSEDTEELDPLSGVYDVQAQHVSTGAVRTVAEGKFSLYRDITRLRQTSIPIHTTETPAPFAADLPAWLDALTSITIIAGDELEIVKDGITYYVPVYRRA